VYDLPRYAVCSRFASVLDGRVALGVAGGGPLDLVRGFWGQGGLFRLRSARWGMAVVGGVGLGSWDRSLDSGWGDLGRKCRFSA